MRCLDPFAASVQRVGKQVHPDLDLAPTTLCGAGALLPVFFLALCRPQGSYAPKYGGNTCLGFRFAPQRS